MRTLRILLAVLAITTGAPALAQTDISGTWSGMLQAGPGTTLEIHFVLTRTGDGYSAVLKSPTQGAIPETPVSSVSFTDDRLVLTVDALSGRYEGVLEGGKFAGSWSQQGQAIPLELAPYAERVLSAEAKDALRGSWVGDLLHTRANITLTLVFRFEDTADGGFAGFLDSPEEGATGLPVQNITFTDGAVSFAIPQALTQYSGTVSGDSLNGTFTQLGTGMALNMTRGEYRPEGAALSQEAIDRLKGSWVGSVPTPAGTSVAIVFRFESDSPGNIVAFVDSPDQGAMNLPISELTLDGDQLSFVVAAAQASVRATLSADGMSGTWAQGNTTQPLTMARGEYTPTVMALDLSAEAMQRLTGAWRGPMGPVELTVHFERTADGTPVAFVEVPAGSGRRLPVGTASLTGDALEFSLPAVGVSVAGTVAGNQITAQWRQGAESTPLTLTRQP